MIMQNLDNNLWIILHRLYDGNQALIPSKDWWWTLMVVGDDKMWFSMMLIGGT